MVLTGMAPTEANSHLYSEADLDDWQDAVEDYLHQSKTGVLPLAPTEFIHACTIARVEQAKVDAAGIAEDPRVTARRMAIKVQEVLGSSEKG